MWALRACPLRNKTSIISSLRVGKVNTASRMAGRCLGLPFSIEQGPRGAGKRVRGRNTVIFARSLFDDRQLFVKTTETLVHLPITIAVNAAVNTQLGITPGGEAPVATEHSGGLLIERVRASSSELLNRHLPEEVERQFDAPNTWLRQT